MTARIELTMTADEVLHRHLPMVAFVANHLNLTLTADMFDAGMKALFVAHKRFRADDQSFFDASKVLVARALLAHS